MTTTESNQKFGVHDVGGRPGYGAPVVDGSGGASLGVSGSAFAARWEAAVFTMVRSLGAAGVMKNTDQFRHAVERVDPDAYFSHGYYGRWLGGLETLLVEAGELDRETLDARVGELAQALGATTQQVAELVAEQNIASRPRVASDVAKLPNSPNPVSSVRYVAQPPVYALGEQVVAVGFDKRGGHTRLPEYARGCVGEVVAWHRGWVLPDTNAHQGEEAPAHLYTVAFSTQVLYGPEAEPGVVVHLDLFEPYLSPYGDP